MNKTLLSAKLDQGHTEGAGSLWQRHLFTYFSSIILSQGFSLSNCSVSPLHEVKSQDLDELNADWSNIFQFLIQADASRSNFLGQPRDRVLREPSGRFRTTEVDWGWSYKIYETQTPEFRKYLVHRCRDEMWSSIIYKPKQTHFDQSYVNVALHLRNFSKGDVVDVSNSLPYQLFTVDYGLPDQNPKFYAWFYSTLLTTIAAKFGISNTKITIFSTGEQHDFSGLLKSTRNLNVNLVLEGYTPDDFYHLCAADVLVSAQSSFSWLATFFNQGHKFIRAGFRHLLPFDVIEVMNPEELKII
jgi:hypothetical protein